MRTIEYFGRELTLEEFVEKEICKNGGTQSAAFKDDLCDLCRKRGIAYEDKMTKKELFLLLIGDECNHKELAETFGVGVSSQMYQKSFGISHKDVKCLEKKGILKVVGSYRFRAFGKYNYAPVYDVCQFCEMKKEEIDSLLVKNIKDLSI